MSQASRPLCTRHPKVIGSISPDGLGAGLAPMRLSKPTANTRPAANNQSKLTANDPLEPHAIDRPTPMATTSPHPTAMSPSRGPLSTSHTQTIESMSRNGLGAGLPPIATFPVGADNGQQPSTNGLETAEVGQMTGNGEPPAERRQATTATQTSPERTFAGAKHDDVQG